MLIRADERDRTQEGGRNPRIGDDFAHFVFSTGRLPRRLSMRGDCSYREDAANQKYLKVFPQAVLLVQNPFKEGELAFYLHAFIIVMNMCSLILVVGLRSVGGVNDC